VGWLSKKEGNVFDPGTFDSVTFSAKPTQFTVEVLSNVAVQDFYKQVSLNELKIVNGSAEGDLFNFGNKTATITQMVSSYFDENQSLIWVDHHLIPKSVFPRRSEPFQYELTDLTKLEVITDHSIETLVNGLDAEQIVRKFQSSRTTHNYKSVNTAIDGSEYLSINLNVFIANPAQF